MSADDHDLVLRPLAEGDEAELRRIERDVGGAGWHDGLLMELVE